MVESGLADRLAELLGRRRGPAAAAVVTPEGTRTAVLGAGPESDFEIGSISKGVTGLLYADAVERGEVRAESTLGELLPLGDVPAAKVTLGALSTHTSGLPRLPGSAQPLRRTIAMWLRGANPYGEDLSTLIEQARTVTVGSARPSYSNLGYELLGHAVAAGASTTYAEMVHDRIAGPLDLGVFYVPASPAELRAEALVGATAKGRRREPWTGEGLGPAGGVRATIEAMARLTAALLDGAAPGMAALDPVADFSGPGVRIGAAWITIEHKGRMITWHNGGTGGFRSWMGLDREAGIGAVVLSARSVSMDRAGSLLLADARERPGAPG